MKAQAQTKWGYASDSDDEDYEDVEEETKRWSHEDEDVKTALAGAAASSGRRTGGSGSRKSTGGKKGGALKSARSFSFFSRSKRGGSGRRTTRSESDEEDVFDADDSDFSVGKASSSRRPGSTGSSKARLSDQERRSLTRASAKRLGLTLGGEEVKSGRSHSKKRLSLRRRSNDLF